MNNIKKIKTKEDFDSAVEFFRNPSQAEERESLYSEVALADGSALNQAKYKILSETFSGYIKNQLGNAVQATNENEVEIATAIVDSIYVLKDVFKDTYDLVNLQQFLENHFTGFNQEVFDLIYSNPELSKEEIKKLSSVIVDCVNSEIKNEKPNSVDYLLKKILKHPLMSCLEVFDNDQASIDSIANKPTPNVFEKLAVAIADNRLNGNKENYDAMIMFLINADIANELPSILLDLSYNPKEIRDMLLSLVDSQEPTENSGSLINIAAKKINNDKELSFHFKNGLNGAKQLSSSSHSLCDSGSLFEIVEDNKEKHLVALLIHTARGRGRSQNNQQGSTLFNFEESFIAGNKAMNYKGRNIKTDAVITMSILDNLIIGDLDKRNNGQGDSHLKQATKNLSISELYFLTELQSISGVTEVIYTLGKDTAETNYLAHNSMIIRELPRVSIEAWIEKLGHTDRQLLKYIATRLVKIINDNPKILELIRLDTATENGVVTELLYAPIMKTFVNIANIDQNNSKSDIPCILSDIDRKKILEILDTTQCKTNTQSWKTNSTIIGNAFMLTEMNNGVHSKLRENADIANNLNDEKQSRKDKKHK